MDQYFQLSFCYLAERGSGEVGQGSGGAEVGVAEGGEIEVEGGGEGEEEAVVGEVGELQGAAHFPVEGVADGDEGDVVEGVGIALAELVGPEDLGVVQEAAGAAGLGGVGEALGEVGELLAEPVVDLGETFLGFLVAVGLVGELVVAFLHADPVHPGAAHGIGVLEGGDAGEVAEEAVDHQVDLHLADAGDVVVFLLDAFFQFGNGVGEGVIL